MSRYDGLIIPRSYSEYINKTDAATLSAAIAQAMQLGGVSDAYPTANSTKIAQSGGIFKAAQILAADSTTITGATISAGSIVRVFFTAAITGSDASTALVLTYNGVDITVKVNKNGELSNFTAAGENYTYLQAYTTLEMYYDGTNFVIIGNPVVISTTDYTIYTDGTTIKPQAYQEKEWKVLNGTDITTISNYEEISISAYINVPTEVIYSGQFARGQLSGSARFFLGGYYLTAQDFGICNCNLLNGVISIRNFYYGGINYTESAQLKIRYR